MIAWMLYAAVVGVLVSLAARAAEGALRARGLATRWVWAAALIASPVLPLLARLGVSSPRSIPVLPPLLVGEPAAGPATSLVLSQGGSGVGIAEVVSMLWLLGTVLVLAWLAVSALRLRSERAKWRPATLRGVPVLVSPHAGPAALAGRGGGIVVPEWALALDEARQVLMLRHEEEHLAARDPILLIGGLILAGLLPWSPAAWWQLRRLRLAVERDCDARVLRERPDRRAYGELLLEVGRRRSRPALPVAALGEPASFLERRLEALLQRTRRSVRRAAGLGLAAAGLLTMAVCVRDPVRPQPAVTRAPTQAPKTQGPTGDVAAEPAFTPYTAAPDLINREEVAKALERYYPPLLRDAGIGGTTSVWFYIDDVGDVVKTRIQKSSGRPELDSAAVAVGRAMRFTPALNKDEPVPVWVALPIVFGPMKRTAPPDTVDAALRAAREEKLVRSYKNDFRRHGSGLPDGDASARPLRERPGPAEPRGCLEGARAGVSGGAEEGRDRGESNDPGADRRRRHRTADGGGGEQWPVRARMPRRPGSPRRCASPRRSRTASP